jgi:hypothetical protein
MVEQLFAAIHNLRATNIHWMNVSAPGYKTLRSVDGWGKVNYKSLAGILIV